MNWKRGLKYIFLGTAVLVLAATVGGIFLLRSERFHEFVLAKIEQQAEKSTGGRVTIQGYDFHWRNLSADVYGLTLHGREQAADGPLLSVDRLFVNVRIVSAFRKKVDLNEIVVSHPVVHLISYPDGTTNLPTPRTDRHGSSTNLFDFGIRHVLLSQGEIYFQRRKQDLSADLRDLRTEVTYKTIGDRYDGALSYAHGQVRIGSAPPLPHSLQASFTFDRNHAELQSATFSLGESRAWLNAKLENYSTPRLSGAYRLLINPQDFRGLLQNSSLPSGKVTLAGTTSFDSSDSRSFLRAVVADGSVNCPALLVHTPDARTEVRELRGNFRVLDGQLVTSLNAGLLAGRLSASLDVSNLDTTPESSLKASLTAISIPETRAALRSPKAQNIPITGRVDAYAEAVWKGPVNTLRAHADLAVKAAITERSPSRQNIIPLNGAVHANYSGDNNVIVVRDTIFRTAQTDITVNGQISKRSELNIVARSKDVHELSVLIPPKSGPNSPASRPGFDVSGPAVLNARVQGDTQHPRIAGNLSSHDLIVQGDPWKKLDVTFSAGPSAVVVQHGSLVASGSQQATFTLNVGLQDWKYSSASPLTATLKMRDMPIRTLQHTAGVDYPISGLVAADLNIKGTSLDPVGNGTVSLSQARVYDEPVHAAAIKFTAAQQTVHSEFHVQTPAGNVEGTLSYQPHSRAYQARLNSPGIVLAKLELLRARNVPVDGTVTLQASGTGTLDDPQLQAVVEIPNLQVQGTSVQSVHTNLEVAKHRAQFNLTSDFANSSIQGHGTVELRDDYPSDLTFDTHAIPIETLVAIYKPLPNRDFRGQIELHASAHGPLKNTNKMEVHLAIPTFRASYQELQIANVQPIRADYRNETLTVQPAQIQGTGTSFRFEGTIPVAGTQPATLSLVGNVDIQMIRLFDPDIQGRGIVALDLKGVRTSGDLGVEGQIHLNKISLATLNSPLAVQNLNGVLDVRNNQIQITRLEGQTGGGTISAGGTVTYRPQVAMTVSLQAHGVRVRYPDGVRAVVDSNLGLSGDTQDASLNGRVLLSSLGFTNDFDLAKFMGQFSGNSSSAPIPGVAQHLKLNIALQSTSELQLVSSELSLEGQVNLKVQGTAAEPVIVGRATLSNGDIFFLKQRYRLERGILDFVDPNETKPTVNILITTTISQYNLSVTLLGPVDRLRTTYTSDPPLPPVDVINLIARGQTTEEGTTTSFDANAVLAQGLASQVSSRLEKFAGISSLQIDPLVTNNDGDPSARIALQQRVTKNFMFTFSTDVTNAQREVVQGEYQINRRWSVSALRDENGGYAFDARFRKIF